MNYREAAVAAGVGVISAVALWASFEILGLTASLSDSIAGESVARLAAAADVVAALLVVPALIVASAALLSRGLGTEPGRAWLVAVAAFLLVPFLGLPDFGMSYVTAAAPVGGDSILNSVLSPVFMSAVVVLDAPRIPRTGKVLAALLAALVVLAGVLLLLASSYESLDAQSGALWISSLAVWALLPAFAALFVPRGSGA